MNDTPPTPRRRWFRFGLRTMFVVLTVFSVWLGWQAKIVRERKAALQVLFKAGGSMQSREALIRRRPNGLIGPIPFWRLWMGDQTACGLLVPQNLAIADIVRLRKQFPELQVIAVEDGWHGEWDGVGKWKPSGRMDRFEYDGANGLADQWRQAILWPAVFLMALLWLPAIARYALSSIAS